MIGIRKQITGLYMWLVMPQGRNVYLRCALPSGRQDGSILLVAARRNSRIGSRVAIRIPKINANITVDDTFVFISLLLYGGEATILLGAIAGLCSGLRISKKPRTVLFGAGALACAVFATANVLQFAFGTTANLFHRGASLAMIALCVMGLVHYIVHTGLGAIGQRAER